MGHMQICTLTQTHNHTSTPPFSFLQAGCPSSCPTNNVKALKEEHSAVKSTETDTKRKAATSNLQLWYFIDARIIRDGTDDDGNLVVTTHLLHHTTLTKHNKSSPKSLGQARCRLSHRESIGYNGVLYITPFPFIQWSPSHLIHPSLTYPTHHPNSIQIQSATSPQYTFRTDRPTDGIGNKPVPRALKLTLFDSERRANNILIHGPNNTTDTPTGHWCSPSRGLQLMSELRGSSPMSTICLSKLQSSKARPVGHHKDMQLHVASTQLLPSNGNWLHLKVTNYYNCFIQPWTLSRTTQVSRYQKGKTNLDLLEQEIVSGSGISWIMCKPAPCPREITMPASQHSVFYRPDVLPAAQLTASKH